MSAAAPTIFKRKKLLTRPTLKFSEGVPRYVKFESAMFKGKDTKEKKSDGTPKEPATVANVINLEDGSECQIIISAVVKSVLNEEYPNDAYKDKCFEITKQGKQPGKQYNGFNIVEIEDPRSDAVAVEAAPAAKTSKK